MNGRKLYQYAHLNQEVELPKRTIEIKELRLISYSEKEIVFETTVSKGTYIRVLGSDIATKLGTVGYLSELNRDEIGPFNVSSSISIDEVNEKSLISMYDILSQIAEVKVVDDALSLDIKNGKVKEIDHISNNKYLFIVDKDSNPVAMYIKINKDKYIFSRGLF